jgi:hypothetical protein
MTNSVRKAMEDLRSLPEDEQDSAADVIFAYLCSLQRRTPLSIDAATIAARNIAQ